MEAFLQMAPYYSGRDLYYLTARMPMTNEQKLFYCLCLRANKYKFSYGRQSNNTLPDLQIPTLDSIPNYVNAFSLRRYGESLIRQIAFPESRSRYKQTGRTVPLENLFTIICGIPSSDVIRSSIRQNLNWIPYIRPSYRQETSIDAYVNKNAVPSEKVFSERTLYVSTDGQGSHTFSYVSTFEFVPNSNIAVLMPKREMGLQEKLFYAQCITNNRYKFSYGRKPKGERLKSVILPEYPPDYVLNYNAENATDSFSDVLGKV